MTWIPATSLWESDWKQTHRSRSVHPWFVFRSVIFFFVLFYFVAFLFYGTLSAGRPQFQSNGTLIEKTFGNQTLIYFFLLSSSDCNAGHWDCNHTVYLFSYISFGLSYFCNYFFFMIFCFDSQSWCRFIFFIFLLNKSWFYGLYCFSNSATCDTCFCLYCELSVLFSIFLGGRKTFY